MESDDAAFDNAGAGMKDGRCERRPLAQGPAGRIEYCPHCGVMHVHMDAVTVRFLPTALRALRDTLSVALASYEHLPRAGEPSASAPLRRPHDVH